MVRRSDTLRKEKKEFVSEEVVSAPQQKGNKNQVQTFGAHAELYAHLHTLSIIFRRIGNYRRDGSVPRIFIRAQSNSVSMERVYHFTLLFCFARYGSQPYILRISWQHIPRHH